MVEDSFCHVVSMVMVSSSALTDPFPPQCANWLTDDKPADFQYCSHRVADEGVPAMAEPGFMISCTCQDNCHDARKCECQQLTAQESSIIYGKGCGYFASRLVSQQISAYVCVFVNEDFYLTCSLSFPSLSNLSLSLSLPLFLS